MLFLALYKPPTPKARQKKTKLNVTAGKSLTLEDLKPAAPVIPKTTGTKKQVKKQILKTEEKESKLKNKTVQKTASKMIKVEPESESDDESFVSDKSKDDIFGIAGILEEKSDNKEEPAEIKPGAWIVVNYVRKVRQLHFVGQIISVNYAEKVCEV